MTARRPPWAEQLDLSPHPEGGWYRETWRSPVMINPEGYGGPRHSATAIYFLLNPGEESHWHVVRSAEIWLWHAGGPLTVMFGGSGAEPRPASSSTLGPDVAAGHQPQLVVAGGTWQAARPATEPVLTSCVVTPGFDFADFRLAAGGGRDDHGPLG